MTSKISVLLPVFNEEIYLPQCIESILDQGDTVFEICISDNASTDGTWKIIDFYHSRYDIIKAYRQPFGIHSFDNIAHTLRMSTGDYVYLIGGDDYLLPGFFREGLAHVEATPKLIGYVSKMTYFDDVTGESLATLPPEPYEPSINQCAGQLIRFVLNSINHDEIILGIFRRDLLHSAFKRTSSISIESTGIWLFLNMILTAEDHLSRVKISDTVFLNKRYNKRAGNSNYDRGADLRMTRLQSLFTPCIGSICNVARLKRADLISWHNALQLLFKSRYHSSFGWICFGPALTVPLLPLLLLKALWRKARAVYRGTA